MKTIYQLFVLAAFAAGTASCSGGREKTDPGPLAGGEVRFDLAVPQRAHGPVYTADGFRILAFRKNGSDYTYLQDIPLGGLKYAGGKFSGTVQLPSGDYKFLPSYGLVAPGNYTWPLLASAALSDELYVTHTRESFPAVFMLNRPLDEVPSYSVSPDGPKQTVSAKLRRAVSRVDLLFIRADKDAATGDYVEKAGDDVFGPEKLATVKLSFAGANSRLGLSGEKAAGTFDAEHTIVVPADVMTLGTGLSTAVGREGYDFENVLPADIISGSAHLKGTYLIPNADHTATTGFTMLLTSGGGSTRTIALTDKIPVERNKATLIRIYVLGDHLFAKGIRLEAEVDTAWDGSNFVDGEIDTPTNA